MTSNRWGNPVNRHPIGRRAPRPDFGPFFPEEVSVPRIPKTDHRLGVLSQRMQDRIIRDSLVTVYLKLDEQLRETMRKLQVLQLQIRRGEGDLNSLVLLKHFHAMLVRKLNDVHSGVPLDQCRAAFCRTPGRKIERSRLALFPAATRCATCWMHAEALALGDVNVEQAVEAMIA